jgi:RNA polymerase sigma-70 factor, ECF subfamily
MANACPHTREFVSYNRRTDGARADKHATLKSPRGEGRSQPVGQIVTIVMAKGSRRNLFRLVSLRNKSGAEPLLALQTDPVGTKPYPHDSPSIELQRSQVQWTCHSPLPDVTRQVVVRQAHGDIAAAAIVRGDFFVSRPRRCRQILGKNDSWKEPIRHARDPHRSFPVENTIYSQFFRGGSWLEIQMLYSGRTKRALRMSHRTNPDDRSLPLQWEGAKVRLHVAEPRSQSTQQRKDEATGRRPDSILRTRPDSTEWETVQEHFLASRTRFIGLAYSILRNQEDAEDAVQNAMLSAFLNLRKFEGRSAFTTWFTRIVFNAALMIRRKQKSARVEFLAESTEGDDGPWAERVRSPQPDPEMACAEGETFRLMDQLLRRMNPLLRQAFTMAYYDELSLEEASSVLGVTPGTFKSRVFRARQHLIQHSQRFLVAPIHRPSRTLFSSGKNSFALPDSARISSRECAFG